MTAPAGHLAALAALPDMTTARLRWLLAGRDPEAAWAVATGAAPMPESIARRLERFADLRERWAAAAARRGPDEMERWCRELGVAVIPADDPRYPPQLAELPDRPVVLFVRGDPGVLDARRAGVVGTRNPTRRGEQTAARFGHVLAESGVVVVSGLAKGIDGAAHRGALAADAAPPVGVVANGHDRPYPSRHADLWDAVAAAGAVVSEWPPGTPPDAYRFPLRNRILVALSELVVVVESRERGGSLITARLAAERGVDVFAVPGPIDVRASEGSNRLLRDGAAPATGVDDLLDALGLDHRRAGRRRFDSRPLPRGDEATLVTIVRDGPVTIDQLVGRSGMALADVALGVARLERSGWLVDTGGWFEVVDEWAELLP